jgi:HD-GYP domain-containing protein (c-di-GMP phosphodiesterase class II)
MKSQNKFYNIQADMENRRKQASAAFIGGYSQNSNTDFWSNVHITNWPKALEIEGWSETLCLRNKETEEHTLRVAEMTVMLAYLAVIPESEITYVRFGALLHDLGKMGIPDSILLKPGRLSKGEWDVMRKHPDYSYDLIYPVEYFRPCLSIPYSHHERWDGTGYPQGLKGTEIPLSARLFAIVDVWETLSSDRVYRTAWPQDRVMEYIRQQSGTHFDPGVVELFLYTISKKMYATRTEQRTQPPLAG